MTSRYWASVWWSWKWRRTGDDPALVAHVTGSYALPPKPALP